MTLRNIIDLILDTNIFSLLGLILIILIIFFVLWFIWDMLVNSSNYPEGDYRNSTDPNSFENKKIKLILILKFIAGLSLISLTIYIFLTW